MKVAIIGAPSSGKTTLANRLAKELGLPVVHSDDYRNSAWDQQPLDTLRACGATASWLAEGVTVARCLAPKYGLNPDVVVYVWGGVDTGSKASLAKIQRDRAEKWPGRMIGYDHHLVLPDGDTKGVMWSNWLKLLQNA